tara:strand:+ start:639 stop:1460 length:822 start_codon:yes stop_codon:yes gene_type:complete
MKYSTEVKINDINLHILRDGKNTFTNDTFVETTDDEIELLLKSNQQTAIETSFNAFLIKSSNEYILIDAGAGDLFGSIAGNLDTALRELGVLNTDITKLIVTHLHPDHIGGAINSEFNSVFPNAEFILSEKEYNFWSNSANFTKQPESQIHPLAVLDAYKVNLTLAKRNSDLGFGLSTIDLPGHTAGHIGVRISSGNDEFVIAGDIIHAEHLQFSNPNIGVVFDQDYELAKQSRISMLDMLASDEIRFTGGHLLPPAVSRVSKKENFFIHNMG